MLRRSFVPAVQASIDAGHVVCQETFKVHDDGSVSITLNFPAKDLVDVIEDLADVPDHELERHKPVVMRCYMPAPVKVTPDTAATTDITGAVATDVTSSNFEQTPYPRWSFVVSHLSVVTRTGDHITFATH